MIVFFNLNIIIGQKTEEGMCLGEPVQPPTQKAANYVIALKIITFVQFVISVLDVVTVYFIREGILGLIMMVLLISSFRRLSYQSLVSYTFISLFFSITFFVYVMTEVQRGTKIQKVSHQNQYIFSIACVTTAFYLFVSIFCFFPYRQFKTIEYASNLGLQQFMTSNPTNTGRVSQQIDYQMPQDQQQETGVKKEQGTFEAFQGQGVRIG